MRHYVAGTISNSPLTGLRCPPRFDYTEYSSLPSFKPKTSSIPWPLLTSPDPCFFLHNIMFYFKFFFPWYQNLVSWTNWFLPWFLTALALRWTLTDHDNGLQICACINKFCVMSNLWQWQFFSKMANSLGWGHGSNAPGIHIRTKKKANARHSPD